jgi:pyruvate/2-oxoglutarate dehydrogenase complex dihydrolipoamide acyltransferase (E2) component
VYKKDVNIANAVAIDGGLITPVLKNANLKDIMSISADWKVLKTSRPQNLQTCDTIMSSLSKRETHATITSSSVRWQRLATRAMTPMSSSSAHC